MARLSLWPLLGFKNSVPRQDVPITALTGPSRDWLVARKRYRRRAGRAIFGDTLAAGVEVSGILESKWGARCRRLLAAALSVITDGYPTLVGLYTKASDYCATLAYRNTNDDTWQTVGKDFGNTTYPTSGLVTHRVVPLLYRNEYGGVTVHRLNSATHRKHWLAGSRNVLQVGKEIAAPCYDSTPCRWDGDHTVFPTGLIPPLTVPNIVAGTDLGTSTVGPWKGSDAFFYSCLFETESGELSMFTIPRPPGSAWAGYEGLGYLQVDSTNPTHYFDSVVVSFIPVGPPGTKWVHVLRSGKVDVATTGAGAIVQPAVDNLQFWFRVPNGTTTYTATEGNDLSLDADPRIQEMVTAGLQWPPCAKDIGRFDGHITAGNLRANPSALIVAPWLDGSLNKKIDDANLYPTTTYHVAVTSAYLYLRKVVGGVATDVNYALEGYTLRELVDRINRDVTVTPTTWTGCTFASGAHAINLGVLATGVPIGATIVNSAFPSDTVVTGYYGSPKNGLLVSHNATRASAGGGENVVTVVDTSGTTRNWVAQLAPGADGGEQATTLLRTYCGLSSSWANGSNVVTVSDSTYISPGMTIQTASGGDGWPSGTIVTEITDGTHIKVSANSIRLSAGETIDIGYDTGDRTTGLNYGFLRAFGNAFPVVLYFSKSYIDSFRADEQGSAFTAASPGYAQDGLNTWMVRNRRGGPASFGQFMGLADMGPHELHFYAKGRMRLWNARTGTTHVDADYSKSVVSWNCGANSPYAICALNEGVVFSSAEGFFAATAGEGEAWLSEALYDPSSPEGSRGELEYALGLCNLAAANGTDEYAIHAQIHGHVLYVRYLSEEGGAYREIRYDFSGSAGKQGIAQFLQPDGRPYPWSAPLTLPVKVSAFVEDATGVHHYAALDSNAGAADGRLDEIDTGTEDNGSLVIPVGYTGLELPEDLNEIQPTMAYVISTKAGEGLKVGLTREPAKAPEDAEWDNLDIPSSVVDEFGRAVVWLRPEESVRRAAIGARIWDDGTGPCTEVSMIQVEVERVRSTTSSKRGGG